MKENYEIEIKSLLSTKERADSLRESLLKKGAQKKGEEKQLNHYFLVEGVDGLNGIKDKLDLGDKVEMFNKIISGGKKISVRTREKDGNKALFIIKASVGDDTSANGVSRIEFEKQTEYSINELDQILINTGLKYQSKWSRQREIYQLEEMEVTIDKNAGYGYLAEFEIAVSNESDIKNAKDKIDMVMKEIGVEELSQDRLERMFEFYNNNWQDYYGTDKTFIIN